MTGVVKDVRRIGEYGAVEVSAAADLTDPLFLPLFDLWNGMTTDAGPPRYSAFDVLDLPPAVLPHLIVAAREGEGQFRYRLAGTNIDLNNGFPIKDRLLSELGVDNQGILAREFQDTLTGRRPRCSWGEIMRGDAGFCGISRLLCPFLDEGAVPHFVVGLVKFVSTNEVLKRPRSESL